jgi:hypothetical protein
VRVFANLFLILFFADGMISILDELLSLCSTGAGIPGLRTLVAGAVIALAVPIYLCLGIDKRLPKRIFIPLILFIFCMPFSTWFFPSLSGNRLYSLLAAFGQLLVCILTILHIRRTGSHSLLMPVEMFQPPFFSIRNTLIFVAANLFIIPTFLVVLVLSATNSYLCRSTAGFMRLTPGGLQMIEREYRFNNKTVRLRGMIHVGDKHYYDELVHSVPSTRTIILAEGVTDEQNLLRNRFGYGKVSNFLGLASQEKMRFKGRMIEAVEIEKPATEKIEPGLPDILRADVDIRTFHPSTILVLNTFGKHMTDSSSFPQAMIAFNAWANKNITAQVQKTLMNDILHSRNRELLRNLDRALLRYDTIVVPWGAMHLPEIEKSLLDRGFALRQERKIVGIDFRKLFFGRFFTKSEAGCGTSGEIRLH